MVPDKTDVAALMQWLQQVTAPGHSQATTDFPEFPVSPPGPQASPGLWCGNHMSLVSLPRAPGKRTMW